MSTESDLNEEQLLQRGENLASKCGSQVKSFQLAWVLAHLLRHQDLDGTRALVDALPTSPLAFRSKSSPEQLWTLKSETRRALAGISSWRDAATIVGWARRLHRVSGGR